MTLALHLLLFRIGYWHQFDQHNHFLDHREPGGTKMKCQSIGSELDPYKYSVSIAIAKE